MERRTFLSAPALGGAAPGQAAKKQTAEGEKLLKQAGITPTLYSNSRSGWSPFTTPDYYGYADDLVIERPQPGKPHKGKVLAAVQAHSDDIPLYAGGLVAKLVDEGYTAYLIRISNDEAAGATLGRGVVQNEIDNHEVAKALGCSKAFSFYYRNHRMDDCAEIEIRQRLIFLFRVLQVNTIITMDPYNHYDENPDHLVAGRVVEAACWLSGAAKDYPEHYRAGLKPARIREKYYHARSPNGHNVVNRIVDITPYIDQKVRGNVANKGKGPAGVEGSRLRAQLAKKELKLPLLGDDDETANHQYVKHFLMEDWKRLGVRFGLGYAEAFRYIGPDPRHQDEINQYVQQHAVKR